MLATLLCTAPHHHSILDDSPVRTTFSSSPASASSTSIDDRHADASVSSPGSGPSTLPPSPDATATTATTVSTPQTKTKAKKTPMLRKQRRQFSLSLGGGTSDSGNGNATCTTGPGHDADSNANASTTSFTVFSLKSSFAFAALRRSGSMSVSAAGPGSVSSAKAGQTGRWARARLRNASASASSGEKCCVVTESSDASEAKSEGAQAGQEKAKICIGAPSGFRHEFHLGANDSPNPSKELWDEARWRQVIETRMDSMGVHVGLHENENESPLTLHPDSDDKTQRLVKSMDFSTLAAASASPSSSPPPPGMSAATTPTPTPTTTPVRPPRNPKRASANTFTGSVTPEQFASLGAKLAAMEAGMGVGTQVQGVEDALAKLTGTHVRSVSAPGIPEDGILGGSPSKSTTTPKAQKRASLVRRKPVPRLDPEEELALGTLSMMAPPPVPPLPSAPAVMSSLSPMQQQQQQHKLKHQRKSVSTYLLIPDLPASEPVSTARKSMEAEAERKSLEVKEKKTSSGRSSLESVRDAQVPESRTLQAISGPQESQTGSKSKKESTSVSPAAQALNDTDASPRPSLSSLSSSASSSGEESAGSGETDDTEESEAFSTPPMTPTDERTSRDMKVIFEDPKGAGDVAVAVAVVEPENQTEGGLTINEKDVVVARRTRSEDPSGCVA